jgi:hypothetical protein
MCGFWGKPDCSYLLGDGKGGVLACVPPPKMAQDDQDGPKMAHAGPKMAPMWPNMTPRWMQGGPMVPRWLKMAPRWVPMAHDGPEKVQHIFELALTWAQKNSCPIFKNLTHYFTTTTPPSQPIRNQTQTNHK